MSCPANQLLERLLAEALPDSDSAALEAHVEQCRACQERLERLTASARWPKGRLSKEQTRLAEQAFPPAFLARLMEAGQRFSRLERNEFLQILAAKDGKQVAPAVSANAASAAMKQKKAAAPMPPLVTRDHSLWLEADKQAARRRRLAPLVVAFLWPLGAAIATLVLLILAQYIGLVRN